MAERKNITREFVVALTDVEAEDPGCALHGLRYSVLSSNGCPVNNIIPDFNDLVYRRDWQEALVICIRRTISGIHRARARHPAKPHARMNINNNDAVGIKSIEHAIIDKGLGEQLDRRSRRKTRPANAVAVVGSGPAGLAMRNSSRARA